MTLVDSKPAFESSLRELIQIFWNFLEQHFQPGIRVSKPVDATTEWFGRFTF